MSNYPPGITSNDPYFNSDPEGIESAQQEYEREHEAEIAAEEATHCAVGECDESATEDDCYCARHRAHAEDMEKLYRGAKIAGWFEKEITND